MEKSVGISQKIKNRPTMWSSNSSPEYFSKENKNTNLKRCMYIYIAELFMTAKIWKQPKVLIDRWMDKKIYIYKIYKISIYINTYIYIYSKVCVYIYGIYMYVCIYMVFIYVCMYVYIYIFSGILLSPKREWNLVICTTKMDIQGIMLTEINHKEKDKSCITSLMCGIRKIKQMNKHNKTETKS